MTTQGKSLEELGCRAVACKHWRWMPGMLTLKGLNDTAWRVLEKPKRKMHGLIITDSDAIVVCNRGEQPGVPDLSDPATLGCLLHLVRKAWGDADLSADRVSRAHDKLPDVWQVYVFHEGGAKDVLSGRSEIEALVAALEAAP